MYIFIYYNNMYGLGSLDGIIVMNMFANTSMFANTNMRL